MRVFHFSCVIFINTFIVLKLFFLEGIFKTSPSSASHSELLCEFHACIWGKIGPKRKY